ncbi:MAG TPA: hypothetical protein DDE71_07460 [Tenacibaculum sp.]|nr:hypothetical protein [Tenacibaculum sp.]
MKNSTEITQETIANWKKEHGKVFELSTKGATAYIRKPDFNEVDYATSVSIKSPLSFPKEIINQCWLGGDEVIKNDVGHVMGLASSIDKIVQTVEVEVKEV